jgi:hypothetical protein
MPSPQAERIQNRQIKLHTDNEAPAPLKVVGFDQHTMLGMRKRLKNALNARCAN